MGGTMVLYGKYIDYNIVINTFELLNDWLLLLLCVCNFHIWHTYIATYVAFAKLHHVLLNIVSTRIYVIHFR